MFLIFAQGTFYIFHNVVVVLRHLAADNIRALISEERIIRPSSTEWAVSAKLSMAMEMSRPLAEAKNGSFTRSAKPFALILSN